MHCSTHGRPSLFAAHRPQSIRTQGFRFQTHLPSPARRGSRSRTASPPAYLAIRKAPSASVESIEPRPPRPCEVGRPKGRRRKNRRQSHKFFLAPAAPGPCQHTTPSARCAPSMIGCAPISGSLRTRWKRNHSEHCRHTIPHAPRSAFSIFSDLPGNLLSLLPSRYRFTRSFGRCALGFGQNPLEFLACLANLLTHWPFWLKLQEGVEIPEQRRVVALPDVDVGQEEMERRVYRAVRGGCCTNFLRGVDPVERQEVQQEEPDDSRPFGHPLVMCCVHCPHPSSGDRIECLLPQSASDW